MAGGKAFEASAVHQKYIEPTIVVVVVKSDATTRCFKKIFVLVLTAIHNFRVKTRFFGNVDETNAGGWGFRRSASRLVQVSRKIATHSSYRDDLFERQNQGCPAKRFQELAT